ncbi:50S ribosomal protein L33 [Mycoplasmopsis felis]
MIIKYLYRSYCRRKNYITNKSLGNVNRINIKKYCVHCQIHTLHKEEV